MSTGGKKPGLQSICSWMEFFLEVAAERQGALRLGTSSLLGTIHVSCHAVCHLICFAKPWKCWFNVLLDITTAASPSIPSCDIGGYHCPLVTYLGVVLWGILNFLPWGLMVCFSACLVGFVGKRLKRWTAAFADESCAAKFSGCEKYYGTTPCVGAKGHPLQMAGGTILWPRSHCGAKGRAGAEMLGPQNPVLGRRP